MTIPSTFFDNSEDLPTPQRYGAVADGVNNDSPAFAAMFAANPNSTCRIPAGTYLLNTSVSGDGTQLLQYDQGVTLSGAGSINNITKQITRSGGVEYARTGGIHSWQSVGPVFRLTNNAADASFGVRISHTRSLTLPSGFEVALGTLANFPLISGGAGMGRWTMVNTPPSVTDNWAVCGEELNIVNLAGDSGYSKLRGSLPRWAVAFQVVMETTDVISTGGKNTWHGHAGYVTCPSNSLNARGERNKFYNGFVAEKDSIAPGGCGFLSSGDSTADPAFRPNYGLEVDQRWKFGIYTADGVFDGSRAVVLGNDQYLASENQARTYSPKILGVTTSNDLSLSPAKAGGFVNICDSSGVIDQGAVAFRVYTVASAANYIQAKPAVASGSPEVSAQGSDTDIDLLLSPKGAGAVRFGNYAASGGLSVVGYVTVKDAAGNPRKLAVVT